MPGPGCCASRREDLPVVDEQRVRGHFHPIMAGGKKSCRPPMGSGAQAVEQAGRREIQRADADRRDPGTPTRGVLERVDRVLTERHGGIAAPGNDDGFSVPQLSKPVRDAELHGARPHEFVGTCDPHPVERCAIGIDRTAQDLYRCGQIEGDYVVERENNNLVHFSMLSRSWRDSGKCCLIRHS